MDQLLEIGLATCHTVTQLKDGTHVGNQVELEMVKRATKIKDEKMHGGAACDSRNTRTTKTLRQFEFDQHSQLQSCLVEIQTSIELRGTATSKTILFVKGSVKRIVQKCNPNSVPLDFEQTAEELAMDGFYLVAMAMKSFDNFDNTDAANIDHTLLQQQLPREDLEKDLTLLGLLKFRNEIKPDSREVIKMLKKAEIATQIITGDNVWAGVNIGRESGIIDAENDYVLVLDAEPTHFGGCAGHGGRRHSHSRKSGAGSLHHPNTQCKSLEQQEHERTLRRSSAVQEDSSTDDASGASTSEEDEDDGFVIQEHPLLKLHLVRPVAGGHASAFYGEESKHEDILHVLREESKHEEILHVPEEQGALLGMEEQEQASLSHWRSSPEHQQAEALFRQFTMEKIEDTKNLQPRTGTNGIQNKKKHSIDSVKPFTLQDGTTVRFVVTMDAFSQIRSASAAAQENSTTQNNFLNHIIEHHAEKDAEDPSASPWFHKSPMFWAAYINKETSSPSQSAAASKTTATPASSTLLSLLYPNTAVLGSMTPVGKVQAVEYWQKEELFGTQVVGMCGDGGNDSGAVNAADLGLVLANNDEDDNTAGSGGDNTSQAKEATSSSPSTSANEICLLAPFSAQTSSLISLLYLIEGGRCVLMNGLGAVKLFLAFGISRCYANFLMDMVRGWRSEAFQMLDTFVVMFFLSKAVVKCKVPSNWSAKLGGYKHVAKIMMDKKRTRNPYLPNLTPDKPELSLWRLSVWIDVFYGQVLFVVALLVFVLFPHVLFGWTLSSSPTTTTIPAAPTDTKTHYRLAWDWFRFPERWTELDQQNDFAVGYAIGTDTMTQSTGVAANLYNIAFYTMLFGVAVSYSLGGKFRASIWKNWTVHGFFVFFMFPFMFLLGLFWPQTVLGSIMRVNIDNRTANNPSWYFYDILGYLAVRFQQWPEGDEMSGGKVWFFEPDVGESKFLLEKTTEARFAAGIVGPEVEQRLKQLKKVQDTLPSFWPSSMVTDEEYDKTIGLSSLADSQNYFYNLNFDFSRPFVWTPEKIQQLKDLWHEGKHATTGKQGLLAEGGESYNMEVAVESNFLKNLVFHFGGDPGNETAVKVGLYGAMATLPAGVEKELIFGGAASNYGDKLGVSLDGKRQQLEQKIGVAATGVSGGQENGTTATTGNTNSQKKWEIKLSTVPLQLNRAQQPNSNKVPVNVFQVGVEVEFTRLISPPNSTASVAPVPKSNGNLIRRRGALSNNSTGNTTSSPLTGGASSTQRQAQLQGDNLLQDKREVLFMCQELCLASVQLQDGGDGGELGRFMCHWIGMRYTSSDNSGGNNNDNHNKKHSCLLFPRLSADTKVALGPELAGYVRDQFQRRRNYSQQEIDSFINGVAVKGMISISSASPSSGVAAGNPTNTVDTSFRLWYMNRSAVLGWQPRSPKDELDRHNPGKYRDLRYAFFFSGMMLLLVGVLCLGRALKDAYWK
ncbi:unnamed protein product [Amoebophrya sp. A25]|nr:unnamed protein product [Amoebophrya sp. A25]|eukprot:GSA25T00004610001.1